MARNSCRRESPRWLRYRQTLARIPAAVGNEDPRGSHRLSLIGASLPMSDWHPSIFPDTEADSPPSTHEGYWRLAKIN